MQRRQFRWNSTDVAACFMLVYCLTHSSNPMIERYVPPKRRLTYTGLHGVIFQNIELFIVTAVRISNPSLQTSILEERVSTVILDRLQLS
jgi:hypothetical protein